MCMYDIILIDIYLPRLPNLSERLTLSLIHSSLSSSEKL